MNEQEIRAIVRDEIGWAMPQSTKTGILASVVDIRGFDPTGEGSAYQPEPAPGSDAEHPPLGYRLVPVGKARNDGYIFWRHGQWNVGGQVFFGHSVCEGDCPVANPIPAADGDSQASEHRVFVPVVGYSWIPGTPPAPYASEWFFAKLDTGEAVALRELPAGHSYDYKTADETFFSNGRVVAWMQNPDSEYVAHVTDGASQICAECAKLRIENAGHRDEISYLHAIAQRETERADASTGRAVLAERKLAELRAELETTKRLLAESLVAQNRLETLRDALREAMR